MSLGWSSVNRLSSCCKGMLIAPGICPAANSPGARLVDVRTPSEFAAGHIPGAINIPLQQLDSRLTELQPKDTAVVLYCRSGSRSGNAARMLKNAGFAAVHNLGPMSRW